MNYQVLARRYRPRRFEEVVGQESLAATLHGAITQDRLAHAYLFTGPRGVGKTSMARIFAKALNCPLAIDPARDKSEWGQPCNACSVCDAIHIGQDLDVVELDGASHRGIEDIRSIVESVNRPASRSRYKIYIIDEVHMLTREAFNALLKTLEEPPPHVKFFFATTEPHRIPETVLSRCQRFDFHPIGEEAIVKRLAQILESEGRQAEEGLLARVARYGKGGLRDAQTLLDQLMTFCEDSLRVDDLDRMLGRVPVETVVELVGAALDGDTTTVLARAHQCFACGADPAILLDQVIEDLRERLHAAVGAAAKPPVAKSAAPGHEAGKEPGTRVRLDRILASLQVLLDTAGKLKHSQFAQVSVEVVLLKVARLEDPIALEEVLRSLVEIERREPAPVGHSRPAPRAITVPGEPPGKSPGDLPSRVAPRPAHAEAPASAPPAAPPAEAVSARDRAPPRAPAPAPSTPPDLRQLLSVWDQIRVELDSRFPDIAPYFQNTTPVQAPDALDTCVVPLGSEFHFRQMRSPAKQEAFLALVRDVSRSVWKARFEHQGRTIQAALPAAVAPTDRSPGDSSPTDSAPSDSAPASPPEAERTDVRRGVSPSAAEKRSADGNRSEGISKNPVVKKSVELFKGRLV